MMKRTLAIVALLAFMVVAGAHKADADVGFSIGIGIPGLYVGPPVVYSPPAYYYPPPPPSYYPPPSYSYSYAPPAYYAPRYYGGSYVYFGRGFGYRDHRGHGGGRRWSGGRHWR